MAKKPAEKKMDKLVREKAVTKKDFTDKPAPEVWTDEHYNKVVATYTSLYKSSNGLFSDLAKEDMFNQVTALYNRVVEGSLIVEKPVDNG